MTNARNEQDQCDFPAVTIQKKAIIGDNCKISSHSFICEGVIIKDNCFVGHGVMFINDNYPRSVNEEGFLEEEADWKIRFVETIVEEGVTIGTNSTVVGGVTIGKNALVGAGSVVTKSIPAGEIWAGNPAKFLRKKR